MQLQNQGLYVYNSRLLTHLLFWLLYLLLNTFSFGLADDNFERQFTIEVIELPAKLAVAYFNLYVLLPHLLFKKRYGLYAAALFLSMLLGAMLLRFSFLQWIAPIYYPNLPNEPFASLYRLLKYMLFNLSSVVLVTTGLKLFQHWYNQHVYSKALVEQNLLAELRFLRSQIHPHFFFNTLNNLYSLTLKKSEDAPQVVLKLSNMMRYLLYEAEQEEVLLSKEIENMKAYIELEKIRYAQRLDLSLNISGDISGKKVAPLLLLPFVENAFKHGVSTEINEGWITIDLKVKNDQLFFKVENSIHGHRVASATSDDGGIGLKNVQRRLELIYPGAHELKQLKDTDSYAVDLKLSLKTIHHHA
jgi:sensor histidine kinase YesM